MLFIGMSAINKQDVSMIINRSLEQNVFCSLNTFKRIKTKAINLVKDLIIMKEEPIKLLALITSNYRLYYQCKILSQKDIAHSKLPKR